MQILICPPREIAERSVNLLTRNDNERVLSTERERRQRNNIIRRIARFSRHVRNAKTINTTTNFSKEKSEYSKTRFLLSFSEVAVLQPAMALKVALRVVLLAKGLISRKDIAKMKFRVSD